MLELHLTDIHFPYHEPDAWEIVLDVAKTLSPDIVFLGGDVVDFYQVSDFHKDPARRLMLQDDLDVAATELSRLRETCSKAKFYYQEGNHEWRLNRYLWTKAPELSGLRKMKVPELLDFKHLAIDWVPRGTLKKIGELWHGHGDELVTGGQHPAYASLLKGSGNVIFGHYHKLQIAYHRMLDGKVHGAWANGCLCTLTPEYLVLPQWTQSFALVDYTKSGTFHVDLVPFFRHAGKLQCVVAGETYSVKAAKLPRPKSKRMAA
jgi:UDP-2,3-diacylglucosamine pyrophosphatase LpxH